MKSPAQFPPLELINETIQQQRSILKTYTTTIPQRLLLEKGSEPDST